MIPGRLTRSHGGLGLAKHVLRGALWLLVAADADERDPPQPLGVPVAGLARKRHRLLYHLPGTRQLPDLLESPAEADEQQRARDPVGDQVGRTAPEVHLSGDVPSDASSAGGGCQPFRGACAQSGIGRAELHPVAIRLLQVIPDDLVGRVLSELRDEPVDVPLVQRRALPLGNRVVRGVADEDVTETKAVVSWQRRPVGSDQLLANERQQVRADRGSLGLGQQRSDGAAVEEPPFDRAALDHGALRLAELVDARGQQRLQRRRHLELAVPALGPHGDELLDEERVPLGRVDDPLPRLLGEIAEPLHERLAVLLRERVQGEHVALGLGAVHVGRVSNRSGRAVHRRRRGTSCDERGEVLDEVEERRLRPVDVVEDDDEGPRRSHRLEQPADAPGDLLGRDGRVRRSERGLDAHRGELGVARAPERGADVSNLGCELLERPVRDPLAVGKAPPDEHARLRAPEQLPREARLPDAGGADDRRELRRSRAEAEASARSSCSSSARRPTKGAAIGRVNAGTSSSSSSTRKAETGWRFPFSASGATASVADGVADESLGRRADENLARARSLLEALGDVHGVACGERLAACPRRPPRC